MVNRQCEVEDRDRPKTDFPFSVRLGLGLTLDFPFLFFEKKRPKKKFIFRFWSSWLFHRWVLRFLWNCILVLWRRYFAVHRCFGKFRWWWCRTTDVACLIVDDNISTRVLSSSKKLCYCLVDCRRVCYCWAIDELTSILGCGFIWFFWNNTSLRKVLDFVISHSVAFDR